MLCGIDLVKNPERARQHIGVVSQENNLDRSLNVIENLTFHASYFGISRKIRNERAEYLLDQFGLSERKKESVDRLSGGMVRRLMIARALMHEPSVLVFDEPTTGLDPQSRLFLWDKLEQLKRENIAVLMTTHNMDEAERMCDRVAIIDQGSILANNSPKNLMQSISSEQLIQINLGLPEVFNDTDRSLQEEILNFDTVIRVGEVKTNRNEEDSDHQLEDSPQIKRYRVATRDVDKSIVQLLQLTQRNKEIQLSELKILEPSLEDVFIHLTGKELR